MGWFRKKKIQKYFAIFFFAALMFPGLFLFSQSVWAEGEDIITGPGSGVVSDQAKTLGTKNTSATSATPAAAPVVTPGTCSWYEVGCQIRQLIIELLGMFLSFLFRFVMIPAATGFAWTVDPATMTGPSGTLNLAAVYNLWQFIRDFFNLFFILILLFSAFATIFQVDSFNIRNIFKNILLVALFINFSFPITRFLIDAANVPMYYFINDVLGNGSGSGGMIAMQSMFAYSGTGAAAFTNVQDGDMAPLIMGIVFVFLFSISLFVLAFMMIIRLIALTMLLIFSPIGFAASLLPGLDKFGREWWENFWKYALFGPSAALMLMISIKFMAGVAGSGIWNNLGDYAGGQSPDAASATFLAQVVFFCIPIIMIWFTIGMASKSSLVGASVVVGLGYALPRAIGNYTKTKVVNTAKFAGNTAKKAAGATLGATARVVLPLDHMKGAYAGVKTAFKEDGKIGGRKVVPDFLIQKKVQEDRERQEAIGKGWARGGKAGVDKELEKMTTKRQYEAAEEMKKNNVGTPALESALRSGDRVQAGAAAMVLTDRKAIKSAADFGLALDALGKNTKEISELIEKAGDDALGKLDATQYQKVMSMSGGVVGADPKLMDELNTRIVKEGNAKVLVEHELNTTVAGGLGAATAAQKEAAAESTIQKIKSAKEVVAQESLFADADYLAGAKREIGRQIAANAEREQQLKRAAAEGGKNISGLV